MLVIRKTLAGAAFALLGDVNIHKSVSQGDFKMNNRRKLVLFLAVISFALVTSAVWANHQWGKYHWARTSNPFTLKVGDNVNTAWDSYLNTTVSDWTASSVLNLSKVTGGGGGSTCNPTSGRVEVCNGSYGNTGWLGVASIWTAGGKNRSHITQGTVKLNDTYFNTAQYNTPAWRNLVSCQEVGHTLGLDHQDTNFNNANLNTCMDYTNDPTSNQHPNQHDYDELVIIYTHLDNTTTVGAGLSASAPPAMNNIDFSSRATWGKMAWKSHDGHVAVYVQDFGNGNKVITRVIFVNPTFETPEPQHVGAQR
jgi:hypothetical protein